MLMRGRVERLEVGVVGAAVGVAKLARESSKSARSLDQRQDAALQRR